MMFIAKMTLINRRRNQQYTEYRVYTSSLKSAMSNIRSSVTQRSRDGSRSDGMLCAELYEIDLDSLTPVGVYGKMEPMEGQEALF